MFLQNLPHTYIAHHVLQIVRHVHHQQFAMNALKDTI